MLICEDDLIAAAQNELGGVLSSLLEHDQTLRLPERVVVDRLSNYFTTPEQVPELLRSASEGVTEMMLCSAHSLQIFECLLQHQPVCKITPSILEAQHEWQRVERLLEFDQEVIPTQPIVIKALKQGSEVSTEVLEALWRRIPGLIVTEEMLQSAVSPAAFLFLLERSPPDLTIL